MAVLLMAGAPCIAKNTPKSKSQKPITIKKLIETVMANGEATTLDNPQAANLGYPAPQAIMDYVAGDTSKDTQLGAVVVLKPTDKSPLELILSSTTVTEWEGETPISIDGYSYRARLSGDLLTAVRAHGKVAAIQQDKLKSSATSMKRFRQLMDAILRLPLPEKTK